MKSTTTYTAVIAEDEPLLAQALQAELGRVWPALRVLASVGDGAAAVSHALALKPDLLLFDIRMPGMSGLEAAAALADEWPRADPGVMPFPALVFVTAYDQYAVQAFEAQAMDYLLKPVQPERLEKSVEKIQLALERRAQGMSDFELTMAQLRSVLAQETSQAIAPLKMIHASVGLSVRMVPVDDVVYFEAADKYVRVLTVTHEYLIRTPLKDLLPQLDLKRFWQIHRGTIVNVDCIDSVSRDETGKLSVCLRKRKERLPVSRIYAHLFKAM